VDGIVEAELHVAGEGDWTSVADFLLDLLAERVHGFSNDLTCVRSV
jgi:hypothetical protein